MAKVTMTRYVASDGTEHESRAEEQEHELLLQMAALIWKVVKDNDEEIDSSICMDVANSLMHKYKIRPHVERRPRKPRVENVDSPVVEDADETGDLAFEEDKHISQ